MDPHSIVVISLHTPKETVWGELLAINPSGITIRGIATRFSGIEARMETEAVDVAVAVARKLCSELIAREPLGEITALVCDCFSHLVATPHLVVRINDQLYEAAREKIERQAAQSGFEGRLVILAEPGIATGDCRIVAPLLYVCLRSLSRRRTLEAPLSRS